MRASAAASTPAWPSAAAAGRPASCRRWARPATATTLNALAESFFASLERELVARSRWRTHAEARTAVFGFVEVFYNRRRRHSALGYLGPAQFEARRCPHQAPAA
jgi:transposase InsO family protein